MIVQLKTQKSIQGINQAIEQVSQSGGGSVVIKKGSYTSGPIHLKSHVKLIFEEPCNIDFTEDTKAYLPKVYSSFEGIRCFTYSPMIYAIDCVDIAVVGKANLNGHGQLWWPMKKDFESVEKLYEAGERGIAVEKRTYDNLRSPMIQFINCTDVLLEGFSMTNSPFWNVHQLNCHKVHINSLSLLNPIDSPNTDSINIESCSDVLVENCNVMGGGDDIFTIKSGRGREARELGLPCHDVEVRNCQASDVNGGGLVIGSESSGGVYNIYAHDCSFANIASATKIKSKRGRGGYVRSVRVENFKVTKANMAICITLKYPYKDICLFDDLPDIGNLEYRNINVDKCTGHSVLIEGLEDCKVHDISLTNIKVGESVKGLAISDAENIKLTDISL